MAKSTGKSVVGVTCEETGDEAVYVNGILARQDSTIYMTDLAAFLVGRCKFEHRTVERGTRAEEDFPEELSDLMQEEEEFQGKTSDNPFTPPGHWGRMNYEIDRLMEKD